MSQFEWRAAKRDKTLKERNLDFADAYQFFDGRPVIHQPTPRHDEDRWKSTALFEGKFFTVVWMWRDGKMQIISMRRSHARKKENIESYSAAELRALKAAGKTRTNWRAAARRPVPNGSDPDDAMAAVNWATAELPMPKRKEHTNLRIDADVMQFFRRQGKGYQTKINAVLRSYVEQIASRETH